MAILDEKCKFDNSNNYGMCTEHSFPVTRSQTKTQKIQMPGLFPTPPQQKQNG